MKIMADTQQGSDHKSHDKASETPEPEPALISPCRGTLLELAAKIWLRPRRARQRRMKHGRKGTRERGKRVQWIHASVGNMSESFSAPSQGPRRDN